jgi:hypothetical protein
MDNPSTESRALTLLEAIKPELLKVLGNAPVFGSCGIDIRFHNSEIVSLAIKAEITKVKSLEKPGVFVAVRK